MRYIEKHRGPATYVLDPPPLRSGDLDLEGGVNAYCVVKYEYESRDSHVRGIYLRRDNLTVCTCDTSI